MGIQRTGVTSSAAAQIASTTFDGYKKSCGGLSAGTKATIFAVSDPNSCSGTVTIKITACDPRCTNGDVFISASDSRLKLIRTRTFVDGNGINSRESFYSGVFGDIALGNLPDATVNFAIDDQCGNATALKTFDIIVQDNASPNTVCITSHTAAINSVGSVRIPSSVFNNGSSDNCGIDAIYVRRMDNLVPGPIGTCTPTPTADVCPLGTFRDYVDFGCNDAGKDFMVVLRVVDVNGNFSDCMVNVTIQNKGGVTCVPPTTRSTFCNALATTEGRPGRAIRIEEQLAQADALFGTPFVYDNCGVPTVTQTSTKNLDQCQVGFITRTWTVTGCATSTTCSQRINVRTASNFIVDFPDDRIITCSPNFISAAALKARMLEPGSIAKYGYGIQNNGCGELRVDIKDDTLMGASNFCLVI